MGFEGCVTANRWIDGYLEQQPSILHEIIEQAGYVTDSFSTSRPSLEWLNAESTDQVVETPELDEYDYPDEVTALQGLAHYLVTGFWPPDCMYQDDEDVLANLIKERMKTSTIQWKPSEMPDTSFERAKRCARIGHWPKNVFGPGQQVFCLSRPTIHATVYAYAWMGENQPRRLITGLTSLFETGRMVWPLWRPESHPNGHLVASGLVEAITYGWLTIREKEKFLAGFVRWCGDLISPIEQLRKVLEEGS